MHHYDDAMSSAASRGDESSISRRRSNSNRQLDRYSLSSSPIEHEADDDEITFNLLLKFTEKFPSVVQSNLDIITCQSPMSDM
jgi:hypothetical protein